MKFVSFILFILFFNLTIHAQDKKSLNIQRASIAPKIDGELNDPAWQDAELAENFIQFRPD
ncbi:MAG: hypothetical protein KDD23_13755, partial [Winogradskyella sp.]|nr:hypothetical protein [Winogradskyella sp.]